MSGVFEKLLLSFQSLLPKGKSVLFLKQFLSLIRFRVQLHKWLDKANLRSGKMGQGGVSKKKAEVPLDKERGRE